MPKTKENPLFLYWDKLLLLIVAIVAGYILLTRVVSSPLQSDGPGGQKTDPAEMVQRLTTMARNLDRSLTISVPPTPPPSKTVERVREYLQGITAQTSFVPLTQNMPREDQQGPARITTPLVLTPLNLRAQGSIGVMASVKTSSARRPTGRPPATTYWVTIAADFPFQGQYRAFAGIEPKRWFGLKRQTIDHRHRLDKEDQYFIFARLELQRQQLLSNGSWSEPKNVNPYQTYQRVIPDIVQTLSQLYSLPLGYEKQDLANLGIFRKWLTQSGFQEFIVRPEFFTLDGFEQWDWPQEPPDTSDEQATTWILAGAIPKDKAPSYRKASTSDSARGPSRRPNVSQAYGRPGPAAFLAPSMDPLRQLSAPVTRIRTTRTTRTSRASKNRVTLPQDYRLQDAPDSIPIWAHDASVSPGSTYRYRLRVLLFNPLCGSERAERAVRRQGWLTGQWSKWSEPVKTFQDRYFFFTGVSSQIAPKPTRARLQVYAWHHGYWFTKLFRSAQGQSIGVPREVPDPSVSPTDTRARRVNPDARRPQPPTVLPRIKIDFATGWFIVELNTNIQIERPIDEKLGQTQTVTTDELVVKNAKTGQIDKRYSDLGSDDPQKKALDDKIKRQKAALQPTTPARLRSSERRPLSGRPPTARPDRGKDLFW